MGHDLLKGVTEGLGAGKTLMWFSGERDMENIYNLGR